MKGRIDGLQTKFVQIPREENECADCLAKAASTEYMLIPDQVLSFVQTSSFIDEVTSVQEIGNENNWTTPLVTYIRDSMLPDRKDAARKLKVRASRFVLIKEILYKKGFSHLYLRCLGPEEADYVTREVHKGICGNHSGELSMVNKLIQADTTGLLCRRTHRLMSKLATNAKDLVTLSDNHRRNLPL